MTFRWPEGFRRVPDEDWAREPLESLALKYDTVEHHGWYRNLDPTVRQLSGYLAEGKRLLDYSGGTGILADRLLKRLPDLPFGLVIVDSSPKFLRLSLEKLRDEERVAFRLIRYLKGEKRLQFVDEVIDLRFDGVVSTNAIHLYHDLPGTLASWRRVLHPGSRLFVQSGNIRNPRANPGEWIIDETVEAIHEAAMSIVGTSRRFARYREILADPAAMGSYATLRRRYFLPVRPLEHYVRELTEAGFREITVTAETIEADVNEWYEFLCVYHDGVLGWVGGAEKVEGRPPDDASVRDRFFLMKTAMERLFAGRGTFPCCWTYITAMAPY